MCALLICVLALVGAGCSTIAHSVSMRSAVPSTDGHLPRAGFCERVTDAAGLEVTAEETSLEISTGLQVRCRSTEAGVDFTLFVSISRRALNGYLAGSRSPDVVIGFGEWTRSEPTSAWLDATRFRAVLDSSLAFDPVPAHSVRVMDVLHRSPVNARLLLVGHWTRDRRAQSVELQDLADRIGNALDDELFPPTD